MLAKVILPDKSEVTFKYDPLGRRIEKKTAEKTKRFVWDGNNPIHEWEDENLVTWVFDDGFVPTAKITNEGNYSIVSDYLGTPVEAYDTEGKCIWSAELDIYGRVREFTGEEDFIPFRYQGQYACLSSGLYYNRFRYYDPEMGQYTQQDPIGLAGNNPTFYGYVRNSLIEVDPFGLSRKPVNRLPEGRGTDLGPLNRTLIRTNPQTKDILQIRTYDAQGKPIRDIDFGHNHGAGDPHAHDWRYPSEQAPNKVRSDGRPLTQDEARMHVKPSKRGC